MDYDGAMMKRQRFDRILEILGFTKGSELAFALGLTRKSSSHCRQNGVPESRLGDLMRLTRERGRDPMEMLEPVCFAGAGEAFARAGRPNGQGR